MTPSDLTVERQLAITLAREVGDLLHHERSGARRIEFKGSPTNLVTEMDARGGGDHRGSPHGGVSPTTPSWPRSAGPAPDAPAGAGSSIRWTAPPTTRTACRSTACRSRCRPRAAWCWASSTIRASASSSSPSAGAAPTATTCRPGRVEHRDAGASLLATGFPYDIRVNADNNLKEYAAFSVRARGVRRLGSAVLYLSWVAAGRFDGYWELRLGAWDVAAAGLMVEEAGGRLTAIDGGPLDLDTPTVVASNGRIHDQILTVLKEIRRP